MKPGIKRLRAALTARWAEDLRNQARLDQRLTQPATGPAVQEAFYACFNDLLGEIRGAWSPGMAHADGTLRHGYPGVRVSQTRLSVSVTPSDVVVEGYRCVAEDTSAKAPELGLDATLRAGAATAHDALNWSYAQLVAFLEVALGIDLEIHGLDWLYLQIAATGFSRTGQWITVRDIHHTAVADYGTNQRIYDVVGVLAPRTSVQQPDDVASLLVVDLHHATGTDFEIQTFIEAVQLSVNKFLDGRGRASLSSSDVRTDLLLDDVSVRKVLLMMQREMTILSDGGGRADMSEWEFQLQEDLHLFKGVTDVESYLAKAREFYPSRYQMLDAVRIPRAPRPSEAQADSLQATRGPSIFLSHSSQDKSFVRNLADRLRTHGARVWLDEAEMNVGDSLTQKIGAAITDTDYFAIVLSRHSVSSEWVQRELQVALQKEIIDRRVGILPLLLERVAIPPFLRDKKYADFTDPATFEQALRQVLLAVGMAPKDPSGPSS